MAKKKAESGAPKKKQAAKSTGGPAPMINTSLAAEAAAKLVGAKAGVVGPNATVAKESSMFKQMKQNLNKGASASMAKLLDITGSPDQKRTNTHDFGGKQVGRNQTFGADVNRTGVPRRTGGG